MRGSEVFRRSVFRHDRATRFHCFSVICRNFRQVSLATQVNFRPGTIVMKQLIVFAKGLYVLHGLILFDEWVQAIVANGCLGSFVCTLYLTSLLRGVIPAKWNCHRRELDTFAKITCMGISAFGFLIQEVAQLVGTITIAEGGVN